MRGLLHRFSCCLLVLGASLPWVWAQTTGGIEGTVTFEFGNEPLAGVPVEIVELELEVHTDQQGKYRFPKIPTGHYHLTAHLHQLTTPQVEVEITEGKIATVDIKLSLSPFVVKVTVTASGEEEAAFESFQTVESLSSFDLVKDNASTLGAVLENKLGVAKRSFGPGSDRPVIRGFDGDRVLILQDGIRTGSVSSQSGDHGEPIDPASLERLEVVKGPATLLYGSNALGGVVNAITSHHEIHEHPHPGVRGYVTGIGGTANDQAGVSGQVEYGKGDWLVQLGGGRQRTGDYRTPIGVVENSGSELNTGSARIGWLKEKHYLKFGYTYDDGINGVPFAQIIAGIGAQERISIDFRRQTFRATGGLRNRAGFVKDFRLTLNYSDWFHQELENGVAETVFNNDQFVYRGVFTQNKSGPVSGSFGFWGLRRDFKTLGVESLAPPTTQDAFALFALEEIDLDAFRLQFGGRVERNAYSPVGLPGRSFTGLSTSAGIRVPIKTKTALVVNFSRSFRAPALEELYNFGPHVGILAFEIGNPHLDREAGNGVEVSLRHKSEGIRGEVNLFYYDFDDFVFLAPTGLIQDGLIEAQYLQQDSRFTGAEAAFEFRLHPKLWLNVGTDFVDAKLKNTGTPLPRIPPLRGRAGLDVKHKGFSFRPEVVTASDQNKIFPTESRTPGYTVLNFNSSYTLVQANLVHVFSVKAFNLGNRLYRNHLSFIKDLAPEVGRGIRVGYSVRFF